MQKKLMFAIIFHFPKRRKGRVSLLLLILIINFILMGGVFYFLKWSGIIAYLLLFIAQFYLLGEILLAHKNIDIIHFEEYNQALLRKQILYVEKYDFRKILLPGNMESQVITFANKEKTFELENVIEVKKVNEYYLFYLGYPPTIYFVSVTKESELLVKGIKAELESKKRYSELSLDTIGIEERVNVCINKQQGKIVFVYSVLKMTSILATVIAAMIYFICSRYII